MTVNRRFTLIQRPSGLPDASNFRLVEEAVPAIGDGEFLIRNHYVSLDPAIRNWLNETVTYMPPIAIGDALRASTVGVVEASNHPGFAVGDWVSGLNKTEEYSIGGRDPFTQKVDVGLAPSPSAFLSVAGGTGLTAWFGIEAELKPEKGQTLLVSGAAGAVGSIAGQLAKRRGARVVGIAGGAEKCARLTERYGYDAAVDYRGKDVERLSADIAAACPDGIDLVFENVGGVGLDATLLHINRKALIILCGLISEYNSPRYGTRQLIEVQMQGATIKGYHVADYGMQMGEGRRAILDLLARGELVHDEHVLEGIDNALPAFLSLFDGSNQGKVMLKLV
ncbi:NADP-dependent oxidoreductase [Sphingobium sp. Sx8-8]|uniref:NADP-dependent oxidoreductase n=1 Tax=Sphingobium sp. Sx8-8 TaxID=2933617 RepID=UPI001F59C2B2|nr:NADP-dependent oxidoreductase [Sphingobium sp. Sx8-8]